jgi:hypothetical protein
MTRRVIIDLLISILGQRPDGSPTAMNVMLSGDILHNYLIVLYD